MILSQDDSIRFCIYGERIYGTDIACRRDHLHPWRKRGSKGIYDNRRCKAEIEQVKFFKNMVIVKFKGFDNINDIEIYKNKDILITREDAVPLGPDENFIVDLIGLKVATDEGEELGTLKDVLQTGANDVYVVEMTDGKELLLPAIKQCILNVDLEQQTMTVHVLDGLMDL